MLTIGYAVVSKSARVCDTPCAVFSITFSSDTSAKGITLFDDRAANSDRTTLAVLARENETVHLSFPNGLPLQYGMYVTLDTEITNCLITYAIRQE